MDFRWIKINVIIILLYTVLSCKKSDTQDQISGTSAIIFNPKKTYGSVTDIDGNIYKTIQIGTQTWMAENLKVSKFNDGTLFGVPGPASIYIDSYNNKDQEKTYVLYGRLYNIGAFYQTPNVCPTGWHIPSSADWTILINFLGGESSAGTKLKEIGTTHWSYDSGATNESGFTALPGGLKASSISDGGFHYLGSEGTWWSSTLNPNYIALTSGNNTVLRPGGVWDNGFSIRCVKDN